MTECPKCKKRLRLWNISQYCPYCGTNIVFNSFLPQFEKDRRIAEMSIASFRIKIEKLKQAFLSGSAQKMKIAACILPLAGLFIPLGSVTLSTAFFEKKLTFWALDMVYNAFLGEGYFGTVSQFINDPVFGAVTSALKTAMIAFLVMALGAVGIFLCELLCFVGNKRTGVAVTVFSAIGIAGAVFTKIACDGVAKCTAEPVIKANSGLLFIVPVLLFAFAAFAAVFAIKHPPVYSFKEGDELRDDYYTKYKKGKIDLLDIPTPIYESEEEKKEKEKLIRGAYQMNDGEGTENG